MGSEPITVLHVDPDVSTRIDVRERLEEYTDTEVIDAERIDEAVESEQRPVDCVVSEYDLPDGTAFELFSHIREAHPDAACVLYTEAGFEEMDKDRSDDVVVEYLSKRIPGTDERLPEVVRSTALDRLQVGYPVPGTEDERLDALGRYDLVDFTSSDAFDRLTTLVRSYFDVDVVFVGLLRSHEEEIVACQGAQWSSLDRENTICTYSMLEDDVTVVEDVREDRRFQHNERLRELDIRSYAGANLTTGDGQVIGELCLVDSTPRSYDREERHLLELFAEEVMEQIDLRRRLPDAGTADPLGVDSGRGPESGEG